MSVLLKVRDGLYVNPSHILQIIDFGGDYMPFHVWLTRPVTDEQHLPDMYLERAEWAAIEPLVTLPARAVAGSTSTPQSVTRQAVDEIIADESWLATEPPVVPLTTEQEESLLVDLRERQAIVHAVLEAEDMARAATQFDDDDDDDLDDDDFEEESVSASEPDTDLALLRSVVESGNFVILDTETTGLKEDAEICQISIIDSAGNTLLDTLVRPQKPIPAEATRIHGITNDMVKPYPDWLNINEAVWNVCKGKTVIVYNAEYDFRLIVQSEKACEPFALSDWHMVKRVCAMLAYGEYRGIWNDYFGNWKWHKLGDAAARVGYTLPEGMKAHSALADCLMTLAVCRALAGL